MSQLANRERAHDLTFDVLQIALYAFPLGWLALFFVSLLKFNISYVSYLAGQSPHCPGYPNLALTTPLVFSFLPIVILALVFNFSNVLGFT